MSHPSLSEQYCSLYPFAGVLGFRFLVPAAISMVCSP
jgi:hypothetical protein